MHIYTNKYTRIYMQLHIHTRSAREQTRTRTSQRTKYNVPTNALFLSKKKKPVSLNAGAEIHFTSSLIYKRVFHSFLGVYSSMSIYSADCYGHT